MLQLTKAEEEIMQILWGLEQASVKEIVEVFPDPKPANNTVSTLVRILEKKGVVSHRAKGRGYIYFPRITQEEYSNMSLQKLMGNYFQGSLSSMVSFFMKSNKVDVAELDDILELIKKQKNYD